MNSKLNFMILMDLKKRILSSDMLYIYGAGVVAYGIRAALASMFGVRFAAHIVSESFDGARDFEGMPLISLSCLSAHLGDAIIIVATPPEYQADIARSIENQTDCKYILLDNKIQFDIMGEYYKGHFGFRLIDDLSFDVGDNGDVSCEIYMARSANDKPLKEHFALPNHIMPVQAGAALDDCRIADALQDDEGENISSRNRDFSEMTVAYWAWKNRSADWMGVCHYRRVMGLSDEEYDALFASDADAVLAAPYLCAGDASWQYKRYISNDDMNLLLSVMDSRERELFVSEMTKPYLYNHNLVLARQAVFADYCEHIFSVLFRVEEKESAYPPRNDRHMGYFAEILTSAYFTSRADRLNIIHAPEIWMC